MVLEDLAMYNLKDLYTSSELTNEFILLTAY